MSLKGYSQRDLETALGDLWEAVEKLLPTPIIEELTKKNHILAELWECGRNGPVGIGLGRFGGHAVGEDD